MFFNLVKHNLIIFSCILLLINGCNKENNKLIIENKNIEIIHNEPDQLPIKKNYIKKEVKKNKIFVDKKVLPKYEKNNSVIFEFRNERLLQGRNISNKVEEKKAELALSALKKMFKKNVSSNNNTLNLKQDKNISTLHRYISEIKTSTNYQNIIVFLPLTGKYSNFGNKIRKSLDISILNFGSDEIKLVYFDTGQTLDQKVVANLFDKLKPRFVIGPFTREVLLKIKPLAKPENLPILTFSNDIAMLENNVWSLGFSPEEQVESVISCALIHGYKKFGIIAPDNLYGKIISRKSIDLISKDKKNYNSFILLSNEDLNDKTQLYSLIKRFLQYSKTEETHTKFDVIFLGGSKDFILEIAPLLAFFNVDSRYIKILGTEIFNNKEIKNEPSLKNSWFPIIYSKNNDQFRMFWKDTWKDANDYFSNAGFDAGMIAIDYINNLENKLQYFNNIEGLVTGLIFDNNGYVKKPVQVMQIEDLEKLSKIKKCS